MKRAFHRLLITTEITGWDDRRLEAYMQIWNHVIGSMDDIYPISLVSHDRLLFSHDHGIPTAEVELLSKEGEMDV